MSADFNRGYRSEVFDIGGVVGLFASTEDPRTIDTTTFPIGTLCLRTTGEIWQRKTAAADGWLLLNPLTAEGDLTYGGPGGAPTRLAKGLAGQVLKINSGATAPEWGGTPYNVTLSWFYK